MKRLAANAGEPLRRLKAQGHRITKVRSTMVEVLQNSAVPLTVVELMRALSPVRLKPNKTTLYRELSFLIKAGLVVELDFGEGKKRYESSERGHHHHLVCVRCKRIEEVEMGGHLSTQESRIREEYRFQVLHHSLEFFGLCHECQR